MILASALLSAVPCVVHGFTTAEGPVSNLGSGASAEMWASLRAALGVPEAGVALASQVHGATVLVPEGPGLAGEGDALTCFHPGLLVAVRIADCVPILVAGRDRVAAIHAGWRGLAAGTIAASLRALESPEGLVAAVGPCISWPSYEVGEEVIAGIAASGVPESVFVHEGPRRRHADLRAAAAWQLRAAGVVEVDVLPGCTFLDPRLHSHRRDGAQAGRQAAVIGLRGC